MAQKYGITYVPRDPIFSRDETPWHVTLTGILQSLGENETGVDVSWTPPTSPLFTRYKNVIDEFNAEDLKHDSIFTTTVFKHFLLKPDGSPLNFQFGPWHMYSQDLALYRTVNCALMHASLKTMLENKYQIGLSPMTFDTTLAEGWDIDTPEEFEIAKLLYSQVIGDL